MMPGKVPKAAPRSRRARKPCPSSVRCPRDLRFRTTEQCSRFMPKILVIDDDDSLREVIQMSLEHAGFEVIEADNGSVGVQQACAQLPDLILCDVRMEKMDGYRTLAALRQDTATAPIPVILMTGMADTAGMRQGMEMGADDYLSKPFAVPQLVAAVNAR